MAFDYLGTFTKSQFDRLADFATKQLADVDARIQHLTAERIRVGVIAVRFDQGDTVAYKGDPVDSYIGKLLAVYETLGGDPFFDLQVRQKDAQPLFLVRADEGGPARRLSDGRVVGSEALADEASAVLVQQLTAWMSEAIKYKREALERKIRRALDYSDQLADEIRLLNVVKKGKETSGSVENILEEVRLLLQDRNYRAIADDGGRDPNGLMANAPYLAFEPGPEREASEFGRALDGYVTPEEGNR